MLAAALLSTPFAAASACVLKIEVVSPQNWMQSSTIAPILLNFSVKNLSLIQSKWDEIKKATETAIDAVNYFGIDRDNLTAANALIPVI